MTIDYAAIVAEDLTAPFEALFHHCSSGDPIEAHKIEDLLHRQAESTIGILQHIRADERRTRGYLADQFLALVEGAVAAHHPLQDRLADLTTIDRIHSHPIGTARLTLEFEASGAKESELEDGVDYYLPEEWVTVQAYHGRLIWRWRDPVSVYIRRAMTAVVAADDGSRLQMLRRIWAIGLDEAGGRLEGLE